MALKIVINISKKVPGPIDFSSVQASCSIEGEIAAGQDPVAEAARLYAQAEAAVDRQLGITSAPAASSTASTPDRSTTPATSQASASPGRSPSVPGHRRGPSPISPAQLRYLRQLLDQHPAALPLILADHQVAGVELLSSRAASAVIDRLKGPA